MATVEETNVDTIPDAGIPGQPGDTKSEPDERAPEEQLTLREILGPNRVTLQGITSTLGIPRSVVLEHWRRGQGATRDDHSRVSAEEVIAWIERENIPYEPAPHLIRLANMRRQEQLEAEEARREAAKPTLLDAALAEIERRKEAPRRRQQLLQAVYATVLQRFNEPLETDAATLATCMEELDVSCEHITEDLGAIEAFKKWEARFTGNIDYSGLIAIPLERASEIRKRRPYLFANTPAGEFPQLRESTELKE